MTRRYETATRWILAMLFLACVVVVVGVAYRKADNAENATATYDPVSNHFFGFVPPHPVVHYGDPITVRMKFCNSENKPVNGIASLNWQATDPAGKNLVEVGQSATLYAGSRYARAAGPGCSAPRDIDFNQPSEVAKINEQLNLRGIPHAWRISAGFTPVSADGRFGKPDDFVSPPFPVVP